MRHLTADELVDLVEGLVPESDVPHLAGCERCRQHLAELRATLAMAAEAEVPEPSPLFWDHFSTRVREAVATEELPRERWWHRLAGSPTRQPRWGAVNPWVRIAIPMSAAAGVAAIVIATLNAPVPVPNEQAPQIATSSAAPPMSGDSRIELLNDTPDADDPSLTLVAELTAALGWDAAADAGLAPQGSAEHVVAHLSHDELQELQRLLKEELGRKGA